MKCITSLSIACLVTLLAVFVSADVYYDRPCRTDIDAIQGFCLDRYLGKWYEIERYEQEFETNLDCTQAQYGLIDSSTVSVTNSAFSLMNDTAIVAIGTAKFTFPDDESIPAKLNVAFFGAPNDRSNYWVLDTDYENFSVVWSCEPLPDNRSRESYWLLSRTRQLTQDEQVIARVKSLVDMYIDADEIRVTNQSDERCPEF